LRHPPRRDARRSGERQRGKRRDSGLLVQAPSTRHRALGLGGGSIDFEVAVKVLGFDPGAGVTGYALLEVGAGRPTFVRGDSVRDRNRELLPELGIHIALQSAELVAIEDVRAIYPRERFGIRMATAIAHASKVAGTILGYCRMVGVPTVEVTAAAWRRAIVGRAQARD